MHDHSPRSTRAQLPLLASLLLTLAALCAQPRALQAQDAGADRAPRLLEISVSARKRDEILDEVAGSLAVVLPDTLRDADIDRLADLDEFVPNMTLAETGTGTQVLIRGVGSGNNQAFEQSVGQYLDGIHYGRQALLRSPFLDLERVEVLRGPQSVLFGKNSIAGALNLVSVRPGLEHDFRFESLLEAGTGQHEVNAAATLPVGGTWALRVALRAAAGAGFLDNRQAGRAEPRLYESAGRLTLAGDVAGFGLTLKAERSRQRQAGRAVELVRDEANAWPPGSHPLAGLNLTGIHLFLGLPALDARQDGQRQGAADDALALDVDNLTLTVQRPGERADLTWLSGFLRYRQHERCDCDFSPASLFTLELTEDYRQFSQELRLSAPSGAPLDWVGGFYLQRSRLTADEGLELPAGSLFGLLGRRLPDPRSVALARLENSAARRANRQDNQSWSLFAQLSLPLGERLALTLGGRYTHERRRADRSLNLLSAAGGPREDPALALTYRELLGLHSQQLPVPPGAGPHWRGHELQGRRVEGQFTPQAGLEWELTPHLSWHLSAQRGFKAGGFDARGGSPSAFEFEGEEARGLESGLRGRLLDGRLAFSLNAFINEYRNLQVSQFDGRLGFFVGNAARSRARGLELDGRWALAPGLRLDYAWSWLDFRYTDFPDGNCHAGQAPDGHGADGRAWCDYSGRRGKFAPRHALSLALNYERPLLRGWSLDTSLSLNRAGARQVHDNLDPAFLQPASLLLNLRAALSSEHWELGLVGRNLGNERLLHYAADLPMTGSLFGTRSYYAVVGRGRQWALELRYRL